MQGGLGSVCRAAGRLRNLYLRHPKDLGRRVRPHSTYPYPSIHTSGGKGIFWSFQQASDLGATLPVISPKRSQQPGNIWLRGRWHRARLLAQRTRNPGRMHPGRRQQTSAWCCSVPYATYCTSDSARNARPRIYGKHNLYYTPKKGSVTRPRRSAVSGVSGFLVRPLSANNWQRHRTGHRSRCFFVRLPSGRQRQ